MNKKIIIGIVAFMSTFVLAGCNSNSVNDENNLIISNSNSGENIDNVVEQNNNQNSEKEYGFNNLSDEDVIDLLHLDFSNTVSANKISVNSEGTYITFFEDYSNTETQIKITGFEGKVKSMKYMMEPQLVMYGDLLLLSEEGDVYITETHLVDEKEEEIVKEFIMKKVETLHKVEEIAGYEFGSNVNVPVLKYENGNFAEIEPGTSKVSELNIIKSYLIKELFCGEYKVVQLSKNNEESQISSKYDLKLFIGGTSPENDFGMNIRSNTTDEILYTTGDADIEIDFENSLLRIPDGFYNSSDINFERFEFELDETSLDVSIKAYISETEEIVILFK